MQPPPNRAPFDPMKSAAMREAKNRQAAMSGSADAVPLAPHEERALIEAAASGKGVAEEMAMGGTAQRPWGVAQVNTCVNQLLARSLPATFYIQGEISNFRTYDRGHAFFTLKEPGAELPCVLWKDALGRLKFRPKDGMAVIVRGAIKLYEPQGKLQVYVEAVIPQGAGALELAFRQLCDKLRAEGLFAPERKRPIPRLPQHVVIITSRTGDVLHDVLTTAYRRFPGLHAMLYPVRVQGERAAPEIVRAIEQINEEKAAGRLPVDLMLLVRGGGSLEDLWAFNEEAVARAMVASKIPIATGIGHEPDTTIADLVGDLRGPTPTGVAELTIPDARALSAEIGGMGTLLTRDVSRLVEMAESDLERLRLELKTATSEAVRLRCQHVDALRRQVEQIEPRHAIAQGWRRVEEADRHLVQAIEDRLRGDSERLNILDYRLGRCSPLTRLERHRDKLEHLRLRLATALLAKTGAATQKLAALTTQLRVVSPHAVLERGFSITTTKEGAIVRSKEQVKKGDVLVTRLADGTVESTVGKPKQASLF